MREALRSGIPAAVVNACVALLCVTLIVARPGALPLLVAIVVLLVLGYRVYVSLARGYARTQQLYAFVEATGRAAELEDAVPAILSETARLLRAERVQLAVSAEETETLHLVTWENGYYGEAWLDRGTAEQSWWGPALGGDSVLLAQDAAHPASEDRPSDGIAVPHARRPRRRRAPGRRAVLRRGDVRPRRT